LGNHTYDHTNLTSLTTIEDVKEKLQQCTDWLDGHGYTRASKHVAYPYTDYNDLVLTAMNDLGMETGRIGGGRYHLLPFGHNYLIHSNNITSTTTLAEVKKQVDTAIEGGSILVFMFHDLVESPDAGTEWAISDFRELVDYIAAREVECVTIDELFKELTAQDPVPALSSQPMLP
jgi:peptidoglycan/xylan/chitin deacetylase (PgdA/CDA1 family)